ncbi:MAG: AAA family ATPase, partial [Candidatus Dadabacteria bacterium]|nr:AAA family ATPase [Candidatus Dadabacteria bacterium]
MENITLRVSEAPQNVAGRGIAVVDPELVNRLGWRAGEAIEITGKKKAYALIWPGQMSDYGRSIIRIDGILRNDAGVGLDDRVTVRRVEAKPAERLTLYPTEPLRIEGGEGYLTQLLAGRVVSKGSVIPINIMGRRVDLMVTSAQPPADAVIIGEDTAI